MYYCFIEILETELIEILWKAGIKNLDIINKIIKINKKEKINNRKLLEDKSRKFYMDIDCAGEYNTDKKEPYITNNIDWNNYTNWNNIHRELVIWYKYFYPDKIKYRGIKHYVNISSK